MIRLARESDVEALRDIYAKYIGTTITFEYRLPAAEEFRERFRRISSEYPYLAYEEAGTVRGYAYASRLLEREAYQWDAELSVYLDPAVCGRGIGRQLCRCLFELLRLQGIRNVCSIITEHNETSVRLHEALGFTLIGRHRLTGYKDGQWLDTLWYEKAIGPHDPDPDPELPFRLISPEKTAAVLERCSVFTKE